MAFAGLASQGVPWMIFHGLIWTRTSSALLRCLLREFLAILEHVPMLKPAPRRRSRSN
jgi:hypothetical protein